MAKLPKALIKKYGISKKAWSIFKSKKKTSRGETMRRKRKSGFFGKRKSAGSNRVDLIQFDSMIYGGARGYISTALQPITSKIPLGNISDEIVMGALCYLAAKNTSGLIRSIAYKGLIIENARLGEAVILGQVGNFMPQSKGSADALAYDY